MSSQRHITQRRNVVHAIDNPGSHAGVIEGNPPHSIAPFRDTAGDFGVTATAAKSQIRDWRCVDLVIAAGISIRADDRVLKTEGTDSLAVPYAAPYHRHEGSARAASATETVRTHASEAT